MRRTNGVVRMLEHGILRYRQRAETERTAVPGEGPGEEPKTSAPCVRQDCPCDSYDGRIGQHCSRSCRDHGPCNHRLHTGYEGVGVEAKRPRSRSQGGSFRSPSAGDGTKEPPLETRNMTAADVPQWAAKAVERAERKGKEERRRRASRSRARRKKLRELLREEEVETSILEHSATARAMLWQHLMVLVCSCFYLVVVVI